jgi:hypothetical protein
MLARTPESKSKTSRIVFIPTSIEDIEKADNFKKLCLQDGLTVHNLMSEAIDLVFKKHNYPPGNPQLTLVNYQEKHATLGKCGFASCTMNAVTTGFFVPQKKEYKLCIKHLKENKFSRDWRIKEVSK